MVFWISGLGEKGTLCLNIPTWKPVWHKLRTFKDAWVYDERTEKSAERLGSSFLKEGHAEVRRSSKVIPLCVFLKVCSLMNDSSHALGKLSLLTAPFFAFFFVCLLFVFRTCSFLADVRQVVVAGNVVPFAVLMGDHHHAVFPTGEEVVGLIFAPVLVLLGTGKKKNAPCF